MFKNIAMRTPEGPPSGASHPYKGGGSTGQTVRYLNRTYRVLPTPPATIDRRKSEIRLSLPDDQSRAFSFQDRCFTAPRRQL